MSAPTADPTRARAVTSVDTGEEISALATIRRGLEFSPELGEGIRVTLLYAVLGTAGRLVVPIAVQQTLDKGINAPGGVDLSFVAKMAVLAAIAIVVTAFSSYLMTARLFTAFALANLYLLRRRLLPPGETCRL